MKFFRAIVRRFYWRLSLFAKHYARFFVQVISFPGFFINVESGKHLNNHTVQLFIPVSKYDKITDISSCYLYFTAEGSEVGNTTQGRAEITIKNNGRVFFTSPAAIN